ncbi:MATE family efflux transporter [Brevibacillus nitrificans]|uniref:MATE family efflux transporter n=1 Tax=Brevibacillus nitrificans TaxID=651560 RepID=UPI002856777B|nr:MATE family efflux transporter [Brevibacillus nitrificans]MDR7314801.1 putative MATE family efflux protein [Brevibacillus nitrificans]
MASLVSTEGQLSVKAKIGLILSLAIPAMMEQILHTLVGFVDLFFVSSLGETAIAAVGVANAMILVFMAIFMAVGISVSSFITQSIGAGKIEEATAYARQSILLSAGMGFVFGVAALCFAGPILRVMGAEPQVLKEAVVYFQIVGGPAIFMALMVTLGSILRSTGDTRTPMKVSLYINLIHIALDYVFIFGIGSFTGWGVAGAALATAIVRVLGAITLLIAVHKTSLHVWKDFSWRESFGKPAVEIIRRSLPVIAEKMIMRFGVLVYYGAIISMGTKAYAAHMIASNLESLMILAGAGFEVAATVLVGQYLGAKRTQDAYSFGKLCTWLGLGLMSVFGLALYLCAAMISGIFTQDAEIQDYVITALTFMALYQPPLALLVVLRGALQGAGDTKAPMYATAVGMWLVRMVGVYLFGFQMGMGLAGVWLSIFLDVLIRGIFILYLYRKRFQHIFRWEGMETAEGIG